MMTHQALVFSVGSIAKYLRLDAEDRILNVLPLRLHLRAQPAALLSVRLGATLVLERSFAFPAKTLERMDDEQVTVFPASRRPSRRSSDWSRPAHPSGARA